MTIKEGAMNVSIEEKKAVLLVQEQAKQEAEQPDEPQTEEIAA